MILRNIENNRKFKTTGSQKIGKPIQNVINLLLKLTRDFLICLSSKNKCSAYFAPLYELQPAVNHHDKKPCRPGDPLINVICARAYYTPSP